MIIKVEQKHIDKGIKTSCHLCPVALAIADSGCIEEGQQVTVGTITASIRWGEEGMSLKTCRLPDFVGDRIRRFDCTGDMFPFDFEAYWEDPNDY